MNQSWNTCIRLYRMYLVLLLVDDVLWRDESLEHGWSLGSSLVSQRRKSALQGRL
jgi:hypothetical protein